MEQQDVNAWMDEIKGSKALPNGRGKVVTIQPPVDIETKFGTRKKLSVIIEGSDGSSINVGLFLPEAYPNIHPKSNLAKLLKTYECNTLKDLIGKEVLVDEHGEGMWKIRIE